MRKTIAQIKKDMKHIDKSEKVVANADPKLYEKRVKQLIGRQIGVTAGAITVGVLAAKGCATGFGAFCAYTAASSATAAVGTTANVAYHATTMRKDAEKLYAQHLASK